MDRIEGSIGLSRKVATDRILDRIERYVTIETPSGDARALCELADVLAGDCEAIGGRIEVFEAEGLGRNLRITVAGREPELEPLYALGHLDTVHPLGTLARQPFGVIDDRVEGPGVYDMKSGIALMVEALALLAEQGLRPRRPTRLVLTCDEEIGSHSARELFAEAAAYAAAVLVPEPSIDDGSVKTRRKGVGTYRIEIRGKAAHAGIEPEKATSAIAEMADQIRTILGLADPERGTTLNIGTIGGGTASNVVAAEAWATIDTRFLDPAEGDRLYNALTQLPAVRPEARVEVRQTELRQPLVRTPAIGALYERAKEIAAGLGVTIGEGMSGGGSDGSIVANLGAPTLDGLGPRGGGAHAVDEHIVLSDLPFRLAFYRELLQQL